jgi:hypothetical protein
MPGASAARRRLMWYALSSALSAMLKSVVPVPGQPLMRRRSAGTAWRKRREQQSEAGNAGQESASLSPQNGERWLQNGLRG